MKDGIANEWTVVGGFKDWRFFVCIVVPISLKSFAHSEDQSLLAVQPWFLGYGAPNSGDATVLIWGLPKLGVPQVIIHFRLGLFSIMNHSFGDIHHLRNPHISTPGTMFRLCSAVVAGLRSLAMRWNCRPSGDRWSWKCQGWLHP